MNRKTIDEILDDCGGSETYQGAVFSESAYPSDVVEKAMIQFADQEMAVFAEWLCRNGYIPLSEDSWTKGLYGSQLYTTQQLHTRLCKCPHSRNVE